DLLARVLKGITRPAGRLSGWPRRPSSSPDLRPGASLCLHHGMCGFVEAQEPGMMCISHGVPLGLIRYLSRAPMEIDQQRLRDEDYRHDVLTALLRDHQEQIFRYCVTRLGEVAGEEVAQEVFLTAWESLPKFRQEASLATWLTGIAKY